MAFDTSSLDVLVIGAGQAGLAAGYYLRNSGSSFMLLDASTDVGGSWRERYDSLVLFTTRRYSALPGLAMPGAPTDTRHGTKSPLISRAMLHPSSSRSCTGEWSGWKPPMTDSWLRRQRAFA